MGALLLLVAGVGIVVRFWPGPEPRYPFPLSSARKLIADLQIACKQHQLDTGLYPTLSPGKTMTDEESMTCLFALLNGDATDGGGKHAYFDFRSEQIVGGVQRVEGEGARRPHPGVPLGTLIDGAWGGVIYYREHRSVRPGQSPEAHNPDSYDLWSPGLDGISHTRDDVANHDTSSLPGTGYELPARSGSWLGVLAGFALAGAGIWLPWRSGKLCKRPSTDSCAQIVEGIA